MITCKSNKKNKGFTLVEIMVCLAIIGFTGVYITYYMVAPINLYNVMSEKSSATTACNAIMLSIHKKVRMADEVKITNTDEKGDTLSFLNVEKDGGIADTIDGKTYAKSIYNRESRNITVNFDVEYGHKNIASGKTWTVLKVTVKEKTKSGTIYSITQDIKCANDGL